MASSVRRADYFTAAVSNKPGEGARVLGALKDSGVNFLAVSGFPRKGRAQMDFVPRDVAGFKNAMKKAGFPVSARKTVFLIQGEDRVGAIAGVLEKLGQAKINVTAVDAVTEGTGRFGAILWVKPADVAKAAKILGAS